MNKKRKTRSDASTTAASPAAPTAATSEEIDDRSAKRRRMPARPTSDFDLTKGESAESTTAYGLRFLETLRNTRDKNGRQVATLFEKLPPRAGNASYYAQIKMPISLEMVERKLHDHEFNTMAELESYLKRMITNAKEFYPRNSDKFNDTERVRKAISNYMCKTNPAYKKTPSYQAIATPIPAELLAKAAEEDKDSEDGNEPKNEAATSSPAFDESESANDEPAVNGESKHDAESTQHDTTKAEDTQVEAEEDDKGQGDDDDDDEAEDQERRLDDSLGTDEEDDSQEEAPQRDQDETEEEEEEEDGPAETPPKPRRGRPPRAKTAARPTSDSKIGEATSNTKMTPAKPRSDCDYEDVPYEGLSFQKAQEKVVEELLHKWDPELGDFYFKPFRDLPPRSLKEYFDVIADPLSLRGLQKKVKGIHGRRSATGKSDFKSWAAFEETASLLWKNAHYFNEEGSEIYALATELRDYFYEQLNSAKAAVEEPQTPKIRLKLPAPQETHAPPPPAPSTTGVKKITIHVNGSKSGAAPSPAPPRTQSPQIAAALVSGQPDTPNISTPAPTTRSLARSSSTGNATPKASPPQLAKSHSISTAPPQPSTASANHPNSAEDEEGLKQQQSSAAPSPCMNGKIVKAPVRPNGTTPNIIIKANDTTSQQPKSSSAPLANGQLPRSAHHAPATASPSTLPPTASSSSPAPVAPPSSLNPQQSAPNRSTPHPPSTASPIPLLANASHANLTPTRTVSQSRSAFRAPGRGLADALLSSVTIRSHPSLGDHQSAYKREFPAHPHLAQRCFAVQAPPQLYKIQIVPRINVALEQQQRQYRMFVMVNKTVLGRAVPIPTPRDPLPVNALVFDTSLQPGINWIEVHIIAALPKGVTLPDGSDCEFEMLEVTISVPSTH